MYIKALQQGPYRYAFPSLCSNKSGSAPHTGEKIDGTQVFFMYSTPASFHGKNPQQTRNGRELPQPNKRHL